MRSKLAFGAATLAAAVALTVVANGVVTSRPGESPSPFGVPAAAADELAPFVSCESLRQWYVEAALPQVGPYGFGFGWPMMYDGGLRGDLATTGAAPLAPADSEAGVGSSGTGTNVQEAGVDEPDRAKTDGSLVVHTRGRYLVVTDVTGDKPRQLGELRLPAELAGAELLLSGDTVLVLGTDYRMGWGGPMPLSGVDRIGVMPYGETSVTRVLQVSITDPTDPTVESDQRLDGNLVSARQYGDVVRTVVRTSYPTLDFVFPNRRRSEKEATEANKQIVRESSIDDWLPTVVVDAGRPEPLVDCSDVQHPKDPSGFGTLSVVTFSAEDPTARNTTAVTAAGDLVYSSSDRLYVATTTADLWLEEPMALDDTVVGPAEEGGTPISPDKPEQQKVLTQVHAFALDGLDTTYIASGKVPGTLRDRWSMSEYDGHLRVATALGASPWNPTDNGITVLAEDGPRLRVVGAIDGLGRNESIQSVRWFDDLAVLVTFRQMDPLYTVDLSNPADPTLLGELKIPGFSAYLHPIGADLLFGVGEHATRQGQSLGGQAAVFDLTDVRDPKRVDTQFLGRYTTATAAWDPRGFNYLPDERVALVNVQDGATGKVSVLALAVAGDGSLSTLATWDLGRWESAEARALPLDGPRVALVDEGVQLVTIPLPD